MCWKFSTTHTLDRLLHGERLLHEPNRRAWENTLKSRCIPRAELTSGDKKKRVDVPLWTGLSKLLSGGRNIPVSLWNYGCKKKKVQTAVLAVWRGSAKFRSVYFIMRKTISNRNNTIEMYTHFVNSFMSIHKTSNKTHMIRYHDARIAETRRWQ